MIGPRLAVAAAIAASGLPGAVAGGVHANARVVGTFVMRARITMAVNVAGEHPGEVLSRRWVIVARRCQADTCTSLELDRQRSAGLYSRVLLRQVGPARYAGDGAFWVALSCRGRVDPHGSLARYQIALQVTHASTVGGVRFAQRIRASYVNLMRSDTTRCPLGPSHDAAAYTGRVIAGLPTAPVASFRSHIYRRTGKAHFRGTSKPGRGNGRIVSRSWRFGDPRSGHRNRSTLAHPAHVYRRPGRYRVTLRIVTADGLTATTRRTIRVRPPARRSPAPGRAR